MIFRATQKVLKSSELQSNKLDRQIDENFPGEWYVDLISLGFEEKFGLLFLHYPSLITIFIHEKNLIKNLISFRQRLHGLLKRHDYLQTLDLFKPDSKPEIYSTNNPSMIAYLKQIRRGTATHCLRFENFDRRNYDYLEDLYLDFPLKDMKDKKNYIWAYRYMDNLINKNENY